MQITDLANEILLHVFQSSTNISSLLALASTCKHFHSILARAYLPTLYQATEAQYGPLTDAIRVVTHNNTQSAHLARPAPPQSLALLKQIIEIGKVANEWAIVYPSQKWRGEDSASRRLLSEGEKYCLRRACYRTWLYNLAFHNPAHSRTQRLMPQVVRMRALLLRPWPSQQLAEILDLQSIFRQVMHSQICPSNGTVLRRHKQRYPEDTIPYVITTGFAKARDECVGLQHGHIYSTQQPVSRFKSQRNTVVEGWGDEITQYYVVEDMLKLDPGQLMYLFAGVTGQIGSDAASFGAGHDCLMGAKGLVEHFVAGLGEWFENNGETLKETIGRVVEDRGEDFDAVLGMVQDGWAGIARIED
ncbi:hypothetical protein P7C71_g5615, partial [Lecanoromycetidae sp. Uapishka_2]